MDELAQLKNVINNLLLSRYVKKIIIKQIKIAYLMGQLKEIRNELYQLKPDLIRDFVNSL
jgi:hypothetical protein